MPSVLTSKQPNIKKTKTLRSKLPLGSVWGPPFRAQVLLLLLLGSGTVAVHDFSSTTTQTNHNTKNAGALPPSKDEA
jgi:hypothetical protein